MSEVYPLHACCAWVTGASSGLGRHFGLLLAANAAHVALAARSIDRVADTAKAITDQGGKALAVALDVTDRASVDAAVARIEDELGPIQILVNNAGVAATAPFLDMTEQDWAQVLDTNLTGVWRVGQAVARRMAPLGRGSIINISSMALLQRLAAVRGRLSLCADQAAAAKWWLSMPMASVSAEGPRPKPTHTSELQSLMRISYAVFCLTKKKKHT